MTLASQRPHPAPAAPAESTLPPPLPLELDDLTQRCLGSLALVERLLASFDQRFPVELCEIARCLESGDLAGLIRSAHQLKGAAANMSAPMLRSILERVEHAARADALAPIPGYLAELDEEWERFCRYRSSTAVSPGIGRAAPHALPAGAKPSIGD
ncbi:MAG TPA: Hpt domain-containing protein [Pirellulales bacterium]